MELQELMNRIKLPKEAQMLVREMQMEEAAYQSWREIFYNNVKEFLEMWKNSEKHLQWILPFYLRLACEVHDEYQRQNIAELGLC